MSSTKWTSARAGGHTQLDVVTFCRYIYDMKDSHKRATVYFDPALHRALRLKAAETDRSVSELINEAVRLSLAEDAEDILAFDDRKDEADLSFDAVVKEMKRSGKI